MRAGWQVDGLLPGNGGYVLMQGSVASDATPH